MAKSELMRTSLYAGGTSPIKMIQAGFYNEDCLVYDLEDSVSAGEKDAARFLVYNAVKYQRPENKYILIRVNGIYSEYLDEDLEAAVRAQPDAIRIPKVEYAEEVKRIDKRMTEIERKAGLPVGQIQIWCNIESYQGVLNAREIATASPRVAAMALGAEDFTASMGAAAFIMAETIGVNYRTVALCAIIPAALYFFQVFFVVDLMAIKGGLKGLPASELPDGKKILKTEGFLLLPIILLVVLLCVIQWSSSKSALWAIGATLIVSWFTKSNKMGSKAICLAFAEAAREICTVALA